MRNAGDRLRGELDVNLELRVRLQAWLWYGVLLYAPRRFLDISDS